MPVPRKHSVIVIGSGITGLSAALHLRTEKIRDVVIISDRSQKASSAHCPGLLFGGTLDNFTRHHHAWGIEFAKEIWQFGESGVHLALQFCRDHQIPIVGGDRLRFASDPLEKKELEQAVSLLSKSGFDAKFEPIASRTLGASSPLKNEDRLALQIEKNSAAIVDSNRFLAGILSATGNPEIVDGDVLSLSTNAGGVAAHLRDGEVVHGEMVLVASHLSIPLLIPQLSPAIVPFSDQWHRIRFADPVFEKAIAGSVFSFQHSYFWGSILSATESLIGGGRHLRRFAGFEAANADLSEKSSTWVLNVLQKLTGYTKAPEIVHSCALRDCRPCDELPIIGPMFGEPRILVGTGYSGNGLATGFHAGKCLAALIANGTSSTLPSGFLPTRLRRLAD